MRRPPLTDAQYDWASQFCGLDTRAGGIYGDPPPGAGLDVPPAGGSPVPPAGNPPATPGDPDAASRSNWTDLSSTGLIAWGGKTDPETRATKKQLATMVSTARDGVADNPGMSYVAPMKDPAGKIVEPGGFLYKGKPPVTPPGMTDDPDPKRSEINAAIWNELANREGGGSSVNTWDTAGITLGAGFAAKDNGGLPAVLEDFLKQDPEAAKALSDVGFTCKEGTFYAVDPRTGDVLKGYRAIDAIAADKKVLSRIIAVLEDPEHAKKFAKAEWDFLKGKAAAVPDDVLKTWPKDVIVLAAHFVHGTSLGWGVWQQVGPDVAALLRRCAGRVASKVGKGAWMVPAVHLPMLLESGNRIGRGVVTGPAALPADLKDGPYSGHVFIAEAGGKYYHLPG